MTNYNDDTPEQIDPTQGAVESLLYSDAETGAAKLWAAIHHEASRLNAHQAHQGRIQAAHQESMSALARLMENNDSFKDPLVQAAGRAAMVVEQYRDLLDAGVIDPEKFRTETGRNVTEQDVFQLHVQGRANGVRGLRSDDELLQATAGQIRDKFGIRPHIDDIDKSPEAGR
jgi:hypothetical protein